LTSAERLGLVDDAHEHCHTLRLVGELDIATAPGLQSAIEELCREGAREIVLDLHQLAFIDSSGLRVILSARQLCERDGCDFSVSRAQPHAQRLFELTDVLGRLSFRGRAIASRITRRQAPATRMPLGRLRPDFEVLLDLNLDAPRAARNYVRDLLGGDHSPELREAAMLLTSELVTPIVARGTSAFLEAGELRVWIRSYTVRVELKLPRELALPPADPGLPRFDEVLDQLAHRWSIDSGRHTACVWFEIDPRELEAGPPGGVGQPGEGMDQAENRG
jgi:anti-sigma B factor antagonist